MNSQTILDTTATETLIRFLEQRFGYSVKLHFTKALRRHKHGTYYPRKQMIHVSRKAPLWVVCHEYAHHMDEQTNHRHMPLGTKMVKVGYGLREGHSESFYRNLRRVIEAVGIVDYPWELEYKQLLRWATRDNLLLRQFIAENK